MNSALNALGFSGDMRFSESLRIFESRYERLDSEDKEYVLTLTESPHIDSRALILGLGNPFLRDDYALSLPGALRCLTEEFSVVAGVFTAAPRHRGKWATSWIADLASWSNGGANGIAFEVLAAKRLLCEKLLGFEMGKNDVCSFGFKLQAAYPGSAGVLRGQPRRSTVESDLQVYIAHKGWEVGVDFKHSSGRRRVRLSKEQIAGLEIALRTGEIDRFWFVTNSTFSRSSHLLVEELNSDLASAPLSYDEPSISVLMEELGVTVEEMMKHGSLCRKVELLEQVAVAGSYPCYELR